MNDYWWIIATLVYTVVLSLGGAWFMLRRQKLGHAALWMAALLVLQTMALGARGMSMGVCPIHGMGEIFFFMGWSLNAFYLLLGRTYRMSALGLFTVPTILFCTIISLAMYNSVQVVSSNHWVTWHAGLAMLAYGAFGLSAVAGTLFLIQNELLKKHQLSGISRILPPVRLLQFCMVRLMISGFILLIVSQVFGYCSGISIPVAKWVVAGVVSAGYMVLLAIVMKRGLPGRWLAWWSICLYALALVIFSVVK